MTVEQIYTGCLAQGAYYIYSAGEGVIIDPLREVQPYIDRAEKDEVEIKYILETHFHADFVSGHVTLAEKTGATIVYGPTANPSFDAHIAEHGQIIKIGNVTLEVLHTPGHTMESTTYLLRDENNKIHSIFTGDTLFLGDVGRPDLAQKAAHMTQEELAGILFDSLRTHIMPLPDDILVYPAHGAGSACGKNMMKETVDTLGNQKKMNYALRADMTRDEFIKEVTDGLAPPPAYFPLNVKLNKEGYESIDSVIKRGQEGLSPEEFKAVVENEDVLVLDVRKAHEWKSAHIPRSIFIGIDGGFAPWVGALIQDTEQKIVLVSDKERVEEVITRLARVGFDHVLGYLKGGIDAWISAGYETDSMDSIDAENLSKLDDPQILDVRKSGEYESSHIEGAQHICLSQINNHMDELPEEPYYIHCAGGYRSVIASSILKSRGHHSMIDVNGGYKAIKSTDLPLVTSSCSA